jgi:hypothetical protein
MSRRAARSACRPLGRLSAAMSDIKRASIHKDVSAADSVPVEPLEMALVSDFKQPFIK